jgi:hypothetical protein
LIIFAVYVKISRSPDIEGGNDYYYTFGNYEEALLFSEENQRAEAHWHQFYKKSI